MIEDHTELLKEIVSEAESLAKTMQNVQDAGTAEAAAKVEDAQRRAAEIDWS